MKAQTALLAVMLSILPPAARAEVGADTPKQESPRVRLQPRFWYHLAAFPAYSLAADVTHEGAHALMALALGKGISRFEPYPHVTDVGDGQQRFVFGVMAMSGPSSLTEDALMLAAPSLMDLALFSAADLTLSYTDPQSWYAPVLWFSCLLWPLIDWTYNMSNLGAFSDVTRVSRILGLNRVGVAVVGDVLAAVGLWRVVHHFIRIFLVIDAVPDAEKISGLSVLDSLNVTPALSPSFTGLALTGRF